MSEPNFLLHQPNYRRQMWLAVVMTAVVVSLASGGGVYWWQQQEMAEIKAELSEEEPAQQAQDQEQEQEEGSFGEITADDLQTDGQAVTASSVVISSQRDKLEITEQSGEVGEYTLQEWRQDAAGDWQQLFPEPPAIPGGYLSPDDINEFSAAALSPAGDRVAFAVNRYVAATDISLVGVLDLISQEMTLLPQEARGVEEVIWSPSGRQLAFVHNTARARGEELSIASIDEGSELFQVNAEKLANALGAQDVDVQNFMPGISEVRWTEEGEQIKFSATCPEGEEIQAVVDLAGEIEIISSQEG